MGNPSNAVTNVAVPYNYLMEKPQYSMSYNRDNGEVKLGELASGCVMVGKRAATK